MAWVTCKYTRGEINRAGDDVIALNVDDPRRDQSLEVINNWRSSHGYPLLIIRKTLLSRGKQVNASVLVAQRLKRLSSIQLKLKQNQTMRLSQMQDIGGCRAILSNAGEVEELVKGYKEAGIRHPNKEDRPFLFREDNYIEQPKPDGYRGVHLIIKYRSMAKPAYNDQNIEVQIRSQLQHAWATAVETCETFTGQALKAKIKKASDQWLRFFALMSSAIAAREKRPNIPRTPDTREERKAELKRIESQEQIIAVLSGWTTAMNHQMANEDHNAAVYLLELDTSTRMLRIRSFSVDEMLFANTEYLAREKATEGNPNVQVVLVSAESVAALQQAYPNYYVDATAFIEAVKQEIY